MFEGTLSNVLIVENESGEVFIVENKNRKPKISEKKVEEKIIEPLPEKRSRRKRYATQEDVDLQDLEDDKPLVIKKEIKSEPQDDEYEALDDIQPNTSGSYQMTSVFIDPDNSFDVDDVKVKQEITPPEPTRIKSENFQATFDGNWSSDENYGDNGDDDFQFNAPDDDDEKPKKKRIRRKLSKILDVREKISIAKHKNRNLRGRIACRYCDVLFATREEKSEHDCKYLQCDPNNFICRFCGKELSRKTFSNHVHEALECQYCGRKILNPRNMKLHIQKKHKGEKFKPPKEKNIEDYLREKEEEEKAIMSRLESIPPIVLSGSDKDSPRVKRSRQFECDLCGKFLVSLRSIRHHMNFHLGISLYVCDVCGGKFFSNNGIKTHSCNKRRTDARSFRTQDMRYCKFCDKRFNSFDENASHECPYKHPFDKTLVICRCCGKDVRRTWFNRHMEFHSGIEWTCEICNRKLATKRALKIHMTMHTGERPFKCTSPGCSESFVTRTVLNFHMRYHGEAQKLFRCEFCFKELTSEYSLKGHINRLHKPTSQCELCKLEFSSRDILKDHMITAHGPAVCKTCGKSFVLPRYLKMHEKLHYTEEEKFPCQFCSKLFTFKKLKPHVFRYHTEHFDQWNKTF